LLFEHGKHISSLILSLHTHLDRSDVSHRIWGLISLQIHLVPLLLEHFLLLFGQGFSLWVVKDESILLVSLFLGCLWHDVETRGASNLNSQAGLRSIVLRVLDGSEELLLILPHLILVHILDKVNQVLTH
jgi:hypothetical protein